MWHISIYTMYALVNKYVFNLLLKTAREGAVLWWQAGYLYIKHEYKWLMFQSIEYQQIGHGVINYESPHCTAMSNAR